MTDKPRKLSTEAYKGVRDFFPEDMAIEKRIFQIWSQIAEKYGYQEYNASVLEPADLYRAKSGEEIVNEQTYTFTDRGDREVTLRPEMTPTVARMVAARRRELIFPLRWYSIPNLFRYEQPQRGRVREHWQLNVDLFGVESTQAEIEVISIAYDITRAYGLQDNQFEIRLNNRRLMDYVTREVFGLDENGAHRLAKLIDKKEKLPPEIFEASVLDVFSTDPKLRGRDETFITLLNSRNFQEFTERLPQTVSEHQGLTEIRQIMSGLEKLGITNVRFDQTLMRGFDYYTGTVFEVYDLNPLNRRSVFGGGRYDDLLSLFGNEKVPAVGFGAGDVIARDLMETYETLPPVSAAAELGLVISGEVNAPFALDFAQSLRNIGTRVATDLSFKKVSDQISKADKRGLPFIAVIGEAEVHGHKVTIKRLADGSEKAFAAEDVQAIADYLKQE